MEPSLAHRFFVRPVALLPEFARGPLALSLTRPEARIVREIEADGNARSSYRMRGEIAEVGISGVLVHTRTGWMDETSYDDITDGVLDAAADPNVRAIVLHIASPGGEVDGAFEAAEAIHSVRSIKPIGAILDPYGYSAAYMLASAAHTIAVPMTGGSGSIGVVAMHVEMSRMLEASGITVTTIQYGDRKTERSPFAPLSDGARQRIQDEVDSLGEMFVDLVANNRGMSAEAVRATKAGTFMGASGVEAGLVDQVIAPQAAFRNFARSLLLDQIGA